MISDWVRHVGQVWTRTTDGAFSIGSGVAITSTFVLTARHVVESRTATDTIRVRFGTQTFHATVAWESGDPELTLLELDQHIADFQNPLIWGRYDRNCAVHWRAAGYPRTSEVVESGERQLFECAGIIQAHSGIGKNSSLLFLDVDTGPAASGWPGFSGAPVLVDGRLVAVVSQLPSHGSGAQLKAIPIAELASGLWERLQPTVEAVDAFPLLHHVGHAAAGLLREHYATAIRAADQTADVRSIRSAAPIPIRLRCFSSIDEVHECLRSWSEIEYPADCLSPTEYFARDTPPRLLVQSPGGFGKTSFLLQLLRTAGAFEYVPIYLDLGNVKKVAAARIAPPAAEDASMTPETLFEAASQTFGLDHFRRLRGDGYQLLLLVDGLNERTIDSRTFIDWLMVETNHPQCRLVITDRMRASVPTPGLSLAAIVPLPKGVVTRLTGAIDSKTVKLLETPLFLNIYLLLQQVGQAPPAQTRAQILDAYFEGEAKLDEAERDRLAEAAFRFYEQAEATDIDDVELRAILRKLGSFPELDAVQTLVDKGLLSRLGRSDTTQVVRVRFRHETLQDYLVAQFLARPGAENHFWRARSFNVATLWGASSDVLELAVESIVEQEASGQAVAQRVDEFLMQLYDWNYRAVVSIIRNMDARADGRASPVSPELRLAAYLLCAEKLFDRFLHTRNDMKRVLGASASVTITRDLKAGDLLATDSIDALLDLAANAATANPQRGQWRTWTSVFTSRGTVDDDRELDFLTHDPMVAWTAANAFRRRGCSDVVYGIVRTWYKVSRRTTEDDSRAAGFRWRLVHLLAKDPSSAEQLLDVIRDKLENVWIRYGASRSYVELTAAATTREARSSLLQKLAAAITSSFRGASRSDLVKTQKIREELARCAVLSNYHQVAPDGWREDYDSAVLVELESLANMNSLTEEVAAIAKLRASTKSGLAQ